MQSLLCAGTICGIQQPIFFAF
jgi:hypothetical protein